nr:10554_t:CDS:10 [Entrophospora candida]
MQSTTPLSPTIKPIIMVNHGSRSVVLKEKFIEIYENFFKGNDPSIGNANFWNELFLLKVNSSYLSKCFSEFSQDHLLSIKKLITSIKYLLIKGESGDLISLNFANLISLSLSSESSNISYDAAILLGILANYKKREFKNPYLIKISEIKDDKIFGALIKVIGLICSKCRNQYIEIQDDDYENTQKLTVSINNNHKFIEFISKNQKDNKKSNNKNDDDNDDSQQHQELFCDFLSFLSYLFQHNRTQRTFKYIKLSLFILTIIIEDDKNAKFIFEDTKLFKIRLCKQKKPILPEVKSSRPIVCFILDICVGFLIHNMRRKLQSDLYSLTLGIIHKIIFQLKTNKIRLDYHWVELWNSLINLLKFIKSNIDYFEDKSVIIKEVLMLVIDIINLSISYGDQFFNEALSYDNLFYEIIRNKETFENLNGLELVTNKRIEQLPSYNEIPYHVSFLRQVLREVVKDFKENYFF